MSEEINQAAMPMEPQYWYVQEAVDAARRSPCAKSKRGAVVFYRRLGEIIGAGYNSPPSPFTCLNNEMCMKDCAKRCVHAEARAIAAARSWSGGANHVASFEVLHIKVNADGVAVPGGGPSCWQCSRDLLDGGFRGIWLWLTPEAAGADRPTWRFYPALEFHTETLKACKIL